VTTPQLVLSSVLIATLAAQALVPHRRVLIVSMGAALSCLLSAALGNASAQTILSEVPWDVLIILVALGLLSRLFAESGLFDRLAVVATRISRGDPRRVTLAFAGAMYFVSGLVNNLTALVLVLPVLLVQLRASAKSQRYVSWTLAVFLVACNLGGAATPIGDFPAILLLGGGRMTFTDYLVRAAPATFIALCLVLLATRYLARPAKDVSRDPLSARITSSLIEALYRGVRIDRRVFIPAATGLIAMLGAWVLLPQSWGITPELVAWIGAGTALLASAKLGEKLVRTGLDGEAILFLLSLFVMVGAVRRAGVFRDLAWSLTELPLSPTMQLMVFLLLAGLIAGVFSAGPSMAALIEVADSFAQHLPGDAVYVGLALSVCAGSSLFLTAATSGDSSFASASCSSCPPG